MARTLILSLLLLLIFRPTLAGKLPDIGEASVDDLRRAFAQHKLTSKQAVEFYLRRIRRLNPTLRAVIEVNPDALRVAEKADRERRSRPKGSLPRLHGIPMLVKDNIATEDGMNTTAGSFALLASVPPRDAGVVTRLRRAGAIVIGKASLSEWSNFRGYGVPSGWSGRGGQGVNPYGSDTPCGSSSGPAISTAANLATVTLGSETDGSILCPSSINSVVGFKPTVGLTSRAGVVPISPRQDSIGPICRTVADATYVLDAIVGVDRHDAATIKASKYIPKGGYAQFLRRNGLKGKRIGIVKHPFFEFNLGSNETDAFLVKTFEQHFKTLRREGAILIDHLRIENIDDIFGDPSEMIALTAEFKVSLNEYLRGLVKSPVRSLADVIAFNNKNRKSEMLDEYGQEILVAAEAADGIKTPDVKAALATMARQTRSGMVKLMAEQKLDALIASGGSAFPYQAISTILAIGGFLGITVPAGYLRIGAENVLPFGVTFGGLKGSEPKLIEIAYAFEQATKVRRPPNLRAR